MMSRISIAAACILAAASAAHAVTPSGIEGRWIMDCGGESYCRLLIERKSSSSYAIFFTHTRPSAKGTPLDGGGEPEPTICEWNAVIPATRQGKTARSGLAAQSLPDGRLKLTGIPPKCAKPGAEATFDSDDVDEFNDL